MTPKPRAGGKVKAWALKHKGEIQPITFEHQEKLIPCGKDCYIVQVEIRELPAVKSRGRKSR